MNKIASFLSKFYDSRSQEINCIAQPPPKTLQTLEKLSADVFLHLMSFLKPRDVTQVMILSRHFVRLGIGQQPLWRRLCERQSGSIPDPHQSLIQNPMHHL